MSDEKKSYYRQGHDYGLGQTNIDHSTGIRYGCISTHSLSPYFWEDVEHDYGPPRCPVCGNDAVDFDDPSVPDFSDSEAPSYRESGSCEDYWCPTCGLSLDASDCFSDEPLGWSLIEGTNAEPCVTHVVDCLDSDALVIKSHYYTFAPFCSPCVPGAGNLDGVYTDVTDFVRTSLLRIGNCTLDPSVPRLFGVKTYCLDKSFFENDACPYPYWSVETNELVYCPGDELEEPELPVEDSLEEKEDALRSMPIEEPSDDVIDEIVRAYRGENGIPAEEFLHDDYLTQKRNED